MALRLGDADLASAALDQATAPALRRGRYGRGLEIEGRRLELLPRLRDQVEIGDVFAMMAWCSGEAGRWSDVVRYASEGERTVEVAINSRLHILAWLAEGRYRTGDWGGAVDMYTTVTGLLGDRRDDPPYYVYNAFGSMALIHTFRGERAESDRLIDLLRRVEAAAGDTARRIWPYVNRLLVARGAVEEAWERFQHPPTGWRIAGACHLEAMCEWVPIADRWDRADDIVAEVRTAADDGDLVGVRLFADRLAGLRCVSRRRRRGRGRDPGAGSRRVPRTRRDVGSGANRRRHRRGAQRHGARRRPAGPAGERRGPVRTSGVGGRAPSGASGIIVLGRGRKRPAPMGRPRSIVVRGSIRLVWRERRRAASWRDGVRRPSRSR